jgi:hypothetical protein
MLMPEVVALTAKARMAPTAVRKIPTPRPIYGSFSQWCRTVVLRGFGEGSGE